MKPQRNYATNAFRGEAGRNRPTAKPGGAPRALVAAPVSSGSRRAQCSTATKQSAQGMQEVALMHVMPLDQTSRVQRGSPRHMRQLSPLTSDYRLQGVSMDASGRSLDALDGGGPAAGSLPGAIFTPFSDDRPPAATGRSRRGAHPARKRGCRRTGPAGQRSCGSPGNLGIAQRGVVFNLQQ